MNDHPYDFLNAEPAPPPELHTLLKYLSDAFALMEEWILQPQESDPVVLQISDRPIEAKSPAGDVTRIYVTRRSHLDATAEDHLVRLRHSDDDERTGYAEAYERSPAGAAELRRDVGLQTVLRTEARSQWNTWDDKARKPEEIRIALAAAPGYYVQCPLDCEGKPMHVVATLELVLDDEDPDGPRTRDIPVNPETERLLQSARNVRRTTRRVSTRRAPRRWRTP